MIAALQMYDWPEYRAQTDAFWSRVSDEMRKRDLDAPPQLFRPDALSGPWTDPDLVLGQTCGLPYVSGRCGDAVLVGRPVYPVEGAGQGTYASALICRKDDPAQTLSGFRGRVAAINELGSQSGCNALADAVMDVHSDASMPFFHSVRMSGAHRSSATMVAKGQADLAAIDAVAWALYGEVEPDNTAKLRVLSWTRPMPALPYITAKRMADHVPVLLESLRIAALSSNTAPLPIGVLPSNDAEYDPIRQMAARVSGLKLAAHAPAL